MRKSRGILALLCAVSATLAVSTVPASAATDASIEVWYSSNYQGCYAHLNQSYTNLSVVHLSGGGLCADYTADNEIVSMNNHGSHCWSFYTGYSYQGSGEYIGPYTRTPVANYPNAYSSVRKSC